jgi:adenylate kinase family enzyme
VRRIAVIGPVASGKSTLARRLGARLGLPVIELDDIYWGADRAFSEDEWPAEHRRLLEPARWIIAGDHRAVADERFAAADTVVWLDLARPVCWWRACRRRSRVSRIACIRWIWRYPAHGRRQTIASLDRHAGGALVVYHLRSRREVREFLSSVSSGAPPARPSPA